MTKERRSYTYRKDDPEPCGEFHNPGHWPYVAACVRIGRHPGLPHVDSNGNQWHSKGD